MYLNKYKNTKQAINSKRLKCCYVYMPCMISKTDGTFKWRPYEARRLRFVDWSDRWMNTQWILSVDRQCNQYIATNPYLFFFFNLLLFSLRSLCVNACFHKDPHVYTLHLFWVIHKLCQYIYSRADSQHSPQIIKQRWADLDVLHVTPLPDNDRS